MRIGGARGVCVADARGHLSDVLAAAAREPQEIYRRDELVGAVVGTGDLAALTERRARTLAEEFAEFRRICTEERWVLGVVPRRDRRNAFDESLDDDQSAR